MDFENGRLSWYLQAIDLTRKIARAYSIEASHDLFGWIVVERRWGRIGGAGRGERRAFATEGAAKSYVRSLLARRATAPRRIGVAYEVIEPVRAEVADPRTDRELDSESFGARSW